MLFEMSGSAAVRFMVPVTPKPITSPGASAFDCWTAARSVHAPPASAQRPSDVLASGVSPRLLTVKLDADAAVAKNVVSRGILSAPCRESVVQVSAGGREMLSSTRDAAAAREDEYGPGRTRDSRGIRLRAADVNRNVRAGRKPAPR